MVATWAALNGVGSASWRVPAVLARAASGRRGTGRVGLLRVAVGRGLAGALGRRRTRRAGARRWTLAQSARLCMARAGRLCWRSSAWHYRGGRDREVTARLGGVGRGGSVAWA
jgi:hypothetical protein